MCVESVDVMILVLLPNYGKQIKETPSGLYKQTRLPL